MSRRPYDRGQFPQRNKTEQEIRLDPRYDTEEASKSGHHLYKRRRVLDRETTTDNYEDSKIFDARFYSQVLLHILNKHDVNAITFKVLACMNPPDWSTLAEAETSEFTVNAGEDKALYFTVAWAFVKVQVKSAVAGNAGTVNAYIGGRSP